METGPLYHWDEGNLAHIAVHRVTREEVEQVLANDPLYIETRIVDGEERDLHWAKRTRAGSFS
jgi:hypothetical protein